MSKHNTIINRTIGPIGRDSTRVVAIIIVFIRFFPKS